MGNRLIINEHEEVKINKILSNILEISESDFEENIEINDGKKIGKLNWWMKQNNNEEIDTAVLAEYILSDKDNVAWLFRGI